MSILPKLSVLVLSVSFLAACQSNDPGQITEGRQTSKESAFFSERPAKPVGSYLTIVRLNLPALLTTATLEDGKVVLNEEHVKVLEEEQKAAIDKLKQVAPEAKVLFKYRLTLNGLGIVVPAEKYQAIAGLSMVKEVSKDEPFDRPVPEDVIIPTITNNQLQKRNSTTFIGAHTVQQTLKNKGLPIDGSGIKVGVIDTGIDYTHKMMGGTGKEEDFKGVDGAKETPHFPNKKVVGGIDLAGSHFNTGSTDPNHRIPQPDNNPMDIAGHGTHVAGTVAGIGDGVNTYDGVAPGADLYAIKVFGDKGSTGDTVVIAALEWSLDPNQDLDLSDKLDVVNLSLGSGFGKPHIMYSVAIENFVKSGSVVVASAGNSGDVDNIVGAPSTSNEALSVAASIDYMDHNWQFDAFEIDSPTHGLQVVELIEGAISTPVKKFPSLKAEMVPAGLGKEPLDEAIAAKVKGKVALMDRGEVSFVDKLKVAQDAGAIGVVMVNDKPGKPIVMGGEVKEPYPFPALMITKAMGDKIKAEIGEGKSVQVQFYSEKKIEKKELIDTITGFSSKGPRSLDSLIKPEITAPGAQITSAAVGKGDQGVRMGGTSMSGPHIAGAMALLKQYHPTLSPQELKSLIMTSAAVMKDAEGKRYPVSRQGAGRAQLFKAATSPIVVDTPALSLGEVVVDRRKVIQKVVTLKSLISTDMQLNFTADTIKGIDLMPTASVLLPANGKAIVRLRFVISSQSDLQSPYTELDGFVNVLNGKTKVGHMPVLAVVNQISRMMAKELSIFASSPDDAAQSLVELSVENKAKNKGEALIFNLLGNDDRKHAWKETQAHLSQSCDLESAGYRLIEKDGETYLQVGLKLYNPVTQWQHCEASLQIDGDADGIADQELVGLALQNVAGLKGNKYNSVLLDAGKVREIRAKYDETRLSGKPAGLSFVTAIQGVWEYRSYNHSSVAMLEAPISLLKRSASGELAIKLAVVSAEGSNVEEDDFLNGHLDKWIPIQMDPASQGYTDIPEVVQVDAGATVPVSLTKGEGTSELMVLYPQNKSVRSSTLKDSQSQIVQEKYLFNP